MPDLSGLPYHEIAFDRTAALVEPGQVDAAAAALASAAGRPADLVVLSHGWNDTPDEARVLYAAFGANFAAALAANGVLPTRRVQLVGLFWPSKRFADTHLAPGDPAHTLINAQLTRVESLAGTDLPVARAEVPRLASSATARRTFVDHVLTTLPPTATQEEAQPAHLIHVSGDPHFLDRLGTPAVDAPVPGGTPLMAHALDAYALQSPGVATGVGGWFSAIDAGALNLLNYATYYLMKDRAGHIGQYGLAPVLARLRTAAPNTRVHLIGHSFGARLVTAAAATSAPGVVDSLSLLQAAFSHYAFARGWDDGATRDGYFRAVVAAPTPLVRGPTLVTFTRNDLAVGIAYAIASRAAGQIASAIGDAHDPYGALGSNGALKTPEATVLRLAPHDEPYAFAPGSVYNLDGNGIPGAPGVIASHTDVCRPEVTHAVAEAVRAADR